MFKNQGNKTIPKHRSKINIAYWIVRLTKDKHPYNPVVLHPNDRTYKK